MIEWIVTSSLLILLVAALRFAVKGRVSPRLRYALWAVVLLRLLVPGQLIRLPAAMPAVPEVPQVAERLEQESIYVLPVQTTPVEDADLVTVRDGAVVEDASPFGYARLEDEGRTVVRYARRFSPIEILRAVWLTGTAAVAGFFLAVNLRFYLRLRRSRRPLPAYGGRLVYAVEGIASPCLFGLLDPAIYLTPDCAESESARRHILAHELTHYRQGDHLWAVLRGVALALHWYNPLVWWAAAMSRRDCELSCDAGAVRLLGEDQRADYGRTLVALVTRRTQPADLISCATTMTGGKSEIKERIAVLVKRQRTTVLMLCAVVLVAAVAVACSFAEGGEKAPVTGMEDTTPEQPATGKKPNVPGDNDQVYSDDSYLGEMPALSGERQEGVYTFLLVGTDKDDTNTDTIMVAAYDTVNQDVSIMSIPRDTMINESWDIKKINSVYARTGNSMEFLMRHVQKLVGFQPDFYVKAELSAFVELVDIVGGVEFDVPVDMDYEDPYQDLSIHLKKGVQPLDGQQALGLVRYRRYNGGDIKRMQVQQDFLRALLEKCLSIEQMDHVKAYIDLAMESVETDLTPGRAIWFAAQALGMGDAKALRGENIYTCTIPGNYFAAAWSRVINCDQSYVTIDPDGVVELVNQRFNPYRQHVTADMLDAMSILENGDIASSTGVLKDTEHNKAMAARRGEAYQEPNIIFPTIPTASDLRAAEPVPDNGVGYTDYWLLAELPGNDIALYCESDGPNAHVFLRTGEKVQAFEQLTLTPRMILPQIYFEDLDGDGEKEILVIYYVGSGTGTSMEELVIYDDWSEDTGWTAHTHDLGPLLDDFNANRVYKWDKEAKSAYVAYNGGEGTVDLTDIMEWQEGEELDECILTGLYRGYTWEDGEIELYIAGEIKPSEKPTTLFYAFNYTCPITYHADGIFTEGPGRIEG